MQSTFARCISTFALLVFVAAAELYAAEPDATTPSVYEKTLREKGIEPTAEGLNAYFRELHPTAEQQQRIARLIEDLGATDSFAAREGAMGKLLVLPSLPIEALTEAMESDDPEIRWRAKLVLDKGRPESRRVLFAAFKVIEQQKLSGTTAELLKAIPLCDEGLFRSAQKSLESAAAETQAEPLRAALGHKNREVRIAAAAALGKALEESAAEDLLPLLEDVEDRVRMSATRALANVGDRRALASLLALLDSGDVSVRSQAASVLRFVTGEKIAFAAYDSEENRAKPLAQWREWVEINGAAAKLNFPLKSLHAELGRTLVCDGGRVVEYDSDKNVIWEVPVGGAWGVYGLPDGRRFVAVYSGRTVNEYDASGNLTKTHSLPGNPYDIQVLENGNFLIPSYDTGKAYEFNPEDGSIVWENASGKPVGATRLENGNTLICMHDTGIVVEFDVAGKEVFSVGGFSQPYTAQRLESGNTLIYASGQGTVSEYDPSGKLVWSKNGLQGYDAQRLENGNTLVNTAGAGVQELDPSGNVVWETSATSVTRFHRY